MNDDDFWNQSDVKSSAQLFSYDDRENTGGFGEPTSLQMCGISLDGTAQLFQQVKAGLRQSEPSSSTTTDVKKSSQFELHQLISERTLNCMLEADSPQFSVSKPSLDPADEVRLLRRQLDEMWQVPDPKRTACRMMLKQPVTLELFKSLESKKKLLEEVINLGDGDSILSVVVFLSRSLKRSLFNQLLLNNRTAAAHYITYLTTRVRTAELIDLLEMLGKSKDASIKSFESAMQQSQRQRRLQRLQACVKNHTFEPRDRHILDNCIKFLDWQNETNIEGESVVDCLDVLCEKHWSEVKGSLSPTLLIEQQGVSARQQQWTAITARARQQAWNDIQTLLTAKSWLRGPKLRVCLPLGQVVTTLHSSGAPQELLYSLLQLIDNPDQRLTTARQINCEKAIIEASISLKDKPSITSFRAALPSGSS